MRRWAVVGQGRWHQMRPFKCSAALWPWGDAASRHRQWRRNWGMAVPGRAAETVSLSLCPVRLSRPVPESGARCHQRLRCLEIVPRRRLDCDCLGVIRPELSGYDSIAGSVIFLESAEMGRCCRDAVLLRRLTETRLMDQLG
jgi:hypothetical protein